MVYRTTGVSVLALMMRAERRTRTARELDLSWLLHGPTDPNLVNPTEKEPVRRLAAE
jgi:hypothetical protein